MGIGSGVGSGVCGGSGIGLGGCVAVIIVSLLVLTPDCRCTSSARAPFAVRTVADELGVNGVGAGSACPQEFFALVALRRAVPTLTGIIAGPVGADVGLAVGAERPAVAMPSSRVLAHEPWFLDLGDGVLSGFCCH